MYLSSLTLFAMNVPDSVKPINSLLFNELTRSRIFNPCHGQDLLWEFPTRGVGNSHTPAMA
jgi:hypothetical protein